MSERKHNDRRVTGPGIVTRLAAPSTAYHGWAWLFFPLVALLDEAMTANPKDGDALLRRARLHAYGHNMDYPEALKFAVLDYNEYLQNYDGGIDPPLEMATLLVNSGKLLDIAESLYLNVQCHYGSTPHENAQFGLYFAYYYQGKTEQAYRQMEYLAHLWPKKPEYQSLLATTKSVTKRIGAKIDGKPQRKPASSC